MISDSQMRYGSRVFCHGRSWRPCVRCQAITPIGESHRWAARLAALQRCIAVGLKPDHGTLRFPSAHPEPLLRLRRRLRLRVLADQLLERAARRGVVAELRLRRRDVEQRVRHLRAVRPQLQINCRCATIAAR